MLTLTRQNKKKAGSMLGQGIKRARQAESPISSIAQF